MNGLSLGLLTWSYPPATSGLAIAAGEIATSLAARGHFVRVFTLDRRHTKVVDGVTIIGVGGYLNAWAVRLRNLAGLGHLVGPLAFAAAVKAAHRVRPFDLVEGTNWYAPGLLVPGLHIPYVTRNSSPAETTIEGRLTIRDRFDGWVARRIEAIAARRSSGLVSNSRDHAHRIAAIYNVLPPDGAEHVVIGLSLPPNLLERANSAAWQGAKNRPLRVLFVGRAERRKGFDAVREAIRHTSHLPLEYVLCGISYKELGLSGRDAEKVRCVINLETSELLAEYAHCHVVLAPSRYESFGLVYQEAMAFGRVLIACRDDPSARDFVGKTGGGLLIDSCRGEDIAQALTELLIEPAKLDRVRKRARSVAGRFTRETLGQETEEHYRSVLSNKVYSRSSSAPFSQISDFAR